MTKKKMMKRSKIRRRINETKKKTGKRRHYNRTMNGIVIASMRFTY